MGLLNVVHMNYLTVNVIDAIVQVSGVTVETLYKRVAMAFVVHIVQDCTTIIKNKINENKKK